jgi:cell division septation protein DedD
MRTFIVLLLLANIAYFGWNQGWLRDAPPATVVRVPEARPAHPAFVPAQKGLVLLEELSQAEREALGQRPLIEEAGAQEAAGVIEGALAQGQAVATTTEEVAPDPANAPEEPVKDSENQGLVEEVPERQGPPWCGELGQFATAAEAEGWLPALRDMGLQASTRGAQVHVATMFWVYLPAFASQQEAQQMLAELQEKSIDSFYMRDGRFAGGISLGVFSRRASAETVQATLARQGYQPQIGEVEREEERFWLVLQAPSAAVLEGPAWADFRAKTGSVNLTENVCENVASGF